MDWLGFALSAGLRPYGSGWRGSELEHQPQRCHETHGFQGFGALLVVLLFIQQGNGLVSLLASFFLAPQGRGAPFFDGEERNVKEDGSKAG